MASTNPSYAAARPQVEIMAASERHSGPIIDLHPAFDAAMPGRRPRRARRPALRLPLWLGLALVALALAAALVALRDPIANALPRTAPAYSAIGVPVAPPLLSIADVEIIRVYAGGNLAVTIEGKVGNATGRQAALAPLELVMLDAAGTPLRSWTLDLRRPVLDPGTETRFTTDPTPLPASAAMLAISIGDGPARRFPLN